MKVAHWIQEPDCSARDFRPVDFRGALAAIRARDRPARPARFRRIEKAGAECCPPGTRFARPGQPVAEGARDGTVETALPAFRAADRAGVDAAPERLVA